MDCKHLKLSKQARTLYDRLLGSQFNAEVYRCENCNELLKAFIHPLEMEVSRPIPAKKKHIHLDLDEYQ